MVLYLSSIEHSNLLDFTGLYVSESEMPIKKLVGDYILKQFIVHDMRNFSHFSDVVLDRHAFGDDDMEFVQAIKAFLTMYNARVTVICEGLQQNSPLFESLLSYGVGNIVCNTDIIQMQQEISECLSEIGMTRYSLKKPPKKQENTIKYHFDCVNIRIVVLSAQPKIGTTTVSIGICTWLQSVGATVCYIEANQSHHLSILARAYEMEQCEGGWLMDGVQYRTLPDKAVNFIVYDVGSDFSNVQGLMNTADLCLLIAGTKPYEYPYSVQLINKFASRYAFILCPFVAEDSRAEFTEVLHSDNHKVLFLEYQPELTSGSVQAKVYRNIIEKYIVGA